MLTRDQLLAPPALHREEVALPGFGDSVFVSELCHADYARFLASVETTPNPKDPKTRQITDPLFGLKLLLKCLVDAEGKRLLQDGDLEALGRLRSNVLAPAIEKASALNTLSDAAVEAEEKN